MTNSFFNLAAGGAIIGMLTACWGQVKAVLWKLLTLFIQRVEIKGTGYLNPVLLGYMIRRYQRSRVYDRTYGAHQEHIREQERNGLVGYEEFGDNSLIMWNGLLPFVFSQTAKSDLNKAASGGYGGSNTSGNVPYTTLTFIRGTLDVEKIIRESIEERNKLNWSNEQLTKDEQKRFYIKYVPDFTKSSRENAQSANSSTLPWYQEGRFRLIGFKPEDLGRGKRERRSALDDLIFPDPVKQLIEEVKLWRVSRDWYHKRGIPWKRGWLLFGPPGTGKTAMARAFAEDLDMPIWVYNLNELSNFEFMKAWIEMQTAAPCIALIEDIDNIFHGRHNVGIGRRSYMSMYHRRGEKQGPSPSSSPGGPSEPGGSKLNEYDDEMMMGGILSFDVFLNMLDGVERNDGVFTIITTNNLDAIDEALGKPRRCTDGTLDFISTRPGRIDKAIELTHMIQRDKIRMAQKILADYPTAMQDILDHLNYNPELAETPAQFQERCAQLALRAFWDKQNRPKHVGLGTRHKHYGQDVDDYQMPIDYDVLSNMIGINTNAKPGPGEDPVGWLIKKHALSEQELMNKLQSMSNDRPVYVGGN